MRLQTPNLAEEESVGTWRSGMVPFETALVISYKPSIVTFLYLCAFQRYCRFCAPAHHFSPLVSSKIFPCSPGIGWMGSGYEERKSWAIGCAISFQDFRPMWSWSTNVRYRETNRWTGRRTTRHAIERQRFALYVHRVVKIYWGYLALRYPMVLLVY